VESKHIYVGDTRIATKRRHEGNDNYGEEERSVYYYHGDHLGSAQLVTDYRGEVYEHVEYTPYGELWVEEVRAGQEKTPFRFTGKRLDEETGLYYYGARYLDLQTSRRLSTDLAMGEYIPQAPVDDEARKRNGNLPGMGGVYNYVNPHVYYYAGNNPVKYIDPTGRADDDWIKLLLAVYISSKNAPQPNALQNYIVDTVETLANAMIGHATLNLEVNQEFIENLNRFSNALEILNSKLSNSRDVMNVDTSRFSEGLVKFNADLEKFKKAISKFDANEFIEKINNFTKFVDRLKIKAERFEQRMQNFDRRIMERQRRLDNLSRNLRNIASRLGAYR
jgi:RHS repeat-associated protein